MNKRIVIGLTGPTGAGKSTAAAEFARLGARVVDCDRLGRELLGSPECVRLLCEAYGDGILGPDGNISRPRLAERAFSSPGASARLNEITHPLIRREMDARIARWLGEGAPAVVVDAALLFESGADASCTVTVAVSAPDEVRLRRIMARDGVTREQAQARMRAQKDAAFYTERAGYCLDGSGEAEGLREQTRALYRRLLEE